MLKLEIIQNNHIHLYVNWLKLVIIVSLVMEVFINDKFEDKKPANGKKKKWKKTK